MDMVLRYDPEADILTMKLEEALFWDESFLTVM